MNDEQTKVLDSDLSSEAMEEDGFRVEQYDDYEDGYYERLDSMIR